MKKKKDINKIADALEEGLIARDFSHAEVMEMFKEFIDETLALQVDFELTDDAIEKFQKASFALMLASKIHISFE